VDDEKSQKQAAVERARSVNVTFVPRQEADEAVVHPPSAVPSYEEIKTMPVEHKLLDSHPTPRPLTPVVDSALTTTGYGRRKRARAAVAIRPGSGLVQVNGRPLADYFPSLYTRGLMLEPIIATELTGLVDVTATVHGGGFSGQAQAIRHALARTLVRRDAELRFLLRTSGMLRRDVRVKERKHTGRRKARTRQQWVKR